MQSEKLFFLYILLNIPMKHDTKIRVLQDKNKVPVLYLKTI
jgi:hypothetical protein